jgi:hypothetical protein
MGQNTANASSYGRQTFAPSPAPLYAPSGGATPLLVSATAELRVGAADPWMLVEDLEQQNEALREQVELLRSSYEELERMYGQKCGEVILLQRTNEALRRPLSSHPVLPPVAVPRGVSEPQAAAAPRPAAAPAAKRPVAVVRGPWWCDMCNVPLNSESSMRAHVQGERHRKRTAKSSVGQSLAAGGAQSEQLGQAGDRLVDGRSGDGDQPIAAEPADPAVVANEKTVEGEQRPRERDGE